MEIAERARRIEIAGTDHDVDRVVRRERRRLVREQKSFQLAIGACATGSSARIITGVKRSSPSLSLPASHYGRTGDTDVDARGVDVIDRGPEHKRHRCRRVHVGSAGRRNEIGHERLRQDLHHARVYGAALRRNIHEGRGALV